LSNKTTTFSQRYTTALTFFNKGYGQFADTAIRRRGGSPTGVSPLGDSPTQRFTDMAFRRSVFRRRVVHRMAVCHFRASELSLHLD